MNNIPFSKNYTVSRNSNNKHKYVLFNDLKEGYEKFINYSG